MLKLGKGYSAQQKYDKVDELILQVHVNVALSIDVEPCVRLQFLFFKLNLEKCKDNRIGSGFVKGISGGEKRSKLDSCGLFNVFKQFLKIYGLLRTCIWF
jgi:hypothetical protein